MLVVGAFTSSSTNLALPKALNARQISLGFRNKERGPIRSSHVPEQSK
jgi:hypothetical protein